MTDIAGRCHRGLSVFGIVLLQSRFGFFFRITVKLIEKVNRPLDCRLEFQP